MKRDSEELGTIEITACYTYCCMDEMCALSLKNKYCCVSTTGSPPALSRAVANVQKQMTPAGAPLSAGPRHHWWQLNVVVPQLLLPEAWRWGTWGWPRRFTWSGHLTRDVTSYQDSALGWGKVWMQPPCLRHVVAQVTDGDICVSAFPAISHGLCCESITVPSVQQLLHTVLELQH